MDAIESRKSFIFVLDDVPFRATSRFTDIKNIYKGNITFPNWWGITFVRNIIVF
jgi:hypothetical protein